MPEFTNQATLFYNNTVVSSNTTVGQLQTVLSVTKTAVVDSYRAGGTVTYVISIANAGAATLTNLRLIDNLGHIGGPLVCRYPLAYVEGSLLYYVNGVLQEEPTVSVGPPLAVSGIDVPANGNALIIYSAEVTQFAPLEMGSTITNTVTMLRGGMIAPVTAEETISVAEEAVLTISKSLSPTEVLETGKLTYTLVVQNSGNTEATAADRVVITDRLDPALEDMVVALDGRVLTEGTDYTYVNGLFATVPGVVRVPAATFERNRVTGIWEVTPGVATLTLTGTV